MLSYEGLFLEEDAVELIRSFEIEHLPKVNDEIHCTFKYHPKNNEIFNEIVGNYFEIYLIGYGCDGLNSGFQILLPDELKQYYINYDEQNPNILKITHITVSLAEGASASNTKNLVFKSLKNPIKLTCRFGYWIKGEDREYLSYEPYRICTLKQSFR